MAVITAKCLPTSKGPANTFTWGPFAVADTASPIEVGEWNDRSVQCYGTFNSTSIAIQGSNDPRVLSDPANAVWAPVKNTAGTAIAFTAAGVHQILDNMRFLRFVNTGGTGTALYIHVFATIKAK